MFRRQHVVQHFLIVAAVGQWFFLGGVAWATTRYASPSGSNSNTPCTNSTTRCDGQTALDVAVAGDTVLFGNGTYTAHFSIRSNSGTAAAPILAKSEGLHGALIRGDGSATNSNYGFSVTRAYWILDGFEMTKHRFPIVTDMGGDRLEVRFNKFHDHNGHGMWVKNVNNAYIHENVVAQCLCTNPDDAWGGITLQGGGTHTVQKNVIYSHTNNRFIRTGGSFRTNGYQVFVVLSSNNLIQGNILMDGAKGNGVRVTTFEWVADPTGPWSSNNAIRDNVIAHGQGGGGGAMLAENAINSTVTNNLIYNTFFSPLVAKGNDPGNNTFSHNTVIMGAYGYHGIRLEVDDNFVASKGTLLRDNLVYSSVNVPQQKLVWILGTPFGTSHHNLFWSPVTPPSTWFSNYTPASTDVRQQPIFTAAAKGDYSLVPGSPGSNAASDGSNIGIAYNSFLRKDWAEKIVTLPIQEWSNPGTSASYSFKTIDGHWYQVFVYLPDSGYYTGIETYYVNGQTGGAINIQSDVISGYGFAMSPPARYIYVGSYPSVNSALAVSWQHSNATAKLLIRQMPSIQEAYTWISGQSTDDPLPAPENVRITIQP